MFGSVTLARNESRLERNETRLERNETRLERNETRLARNETRLARNETRGGNLHLSGTVDKSHPKYFTQILSKKVRLMHERNRKHVPCFYRVIETRVEVWENDKFFDECFYNSIETQRICFLFLLENTATKKTKTTC